jgi:hypothetical protein
MKHTKKPTMEATCFLFMHAEILRQLWLSSHEMARAGKNGFEIAEALRDAANNAELSYQSALSQFKA